jgi:hypothetical protein
MEVELLLGVLIVVIALFQYHREGMATGVYDSETPPDPEQINDIFDQIMSMTPPILQKAYSDGLALAKAALADAKAISAKYPEDTYLAQQVGGMTETKLVGLSKVGIVIGLLAIGRQIKQTSGAITETTLRSFVDPLYEELNERIDRPLPPQTQGGTPQQLEIQTKVIEYAGRARALVKEYKTPEVRDAIIAVLKTYYVDQLTPGQAAAAPAAGAAATTAAPAAPAAEAKCPIGFEMDATLKTCHVSCPPGFAYSNAGGNKPMCSKGTEFEYPLPPNLPPTKESFTVRENLPGDDELSAQQRAAAALQAAQTEQAAAVLRQQEYQAARQKAVEAKYEGVGVDASRDKNAKMYQSSRLRQQTSDMIDDFLKNTRTPRPATAGTPEAQEVKQRKKILDIQAKNLYVIQVGLLTLLLSILAFLVMPMWAAQMSVVLILATGIAAAIYLSQIQ